jgi:hypothetical protein
MVIYLYREIEVAYCAVVMNHCFKHSLRFIITETPLHTLAGHRDRRPRTGPVPRGPDRPFLDPPKNPIVGWSHLLDLPKNGLGWSHLSDPLKNPGLWWSHLWPTGRPGPGTGTGPVTGFWVFRSVTIANSGGEDEDWGEGSGDEEERERVTQLGHSLMERSLPVSRTN